MKISLQIISCLILSFLFTSPAIAADSKCKKSPLVKGTCFKVLGTLNVYNGWSPAIRIETKSKEKLYGVEPEDNELMPNKVARILPTEIEGEFELCPFNETTSVPYDERKIKMVCIQDVNNAWYWDRKTDTKKKLNEK